MLPQELGGGSGMTCWRRLRDWQNAGVWDRLHQTLLQRLSDTGWLDWSRAALDSASVPAPGGEASGPNPTDRGKAGTKRHLLVERGGLPLAVSLPAANVNDCQTLEAILMRWCPCGAAADGLAVAPASCMRTKVTIIPGVGEPVTARHHAAHRPQGHRVERAPGPLSLGGGAHPGVIEPLSALESAL